jgi:hypothetical protein
LATNRALARLGPGNNRPFRARTLAVIPIFTPL